MLCHRDKGKFVRARKLYVLEPEQEEESPAPVKITSPKRHYQRKVIPPVVDLSVLIYWAAL